MTATVSVGLRRSWPQRLLILFGVVLAASSGVAAARLWSLYGSLESIPRYTFPRGVLAEPGSDFGPVNFLLIGTDSAVGLDPDDPVNIGRDNSNSLADVVMLLRVDPTTGFASILSIPRDLWVQVPGGSEMKLAQVLQVGGAERGVQYLVETVTDLLDVPINHVVQIDFAGFRAVVDAVGGVPVYFPFSAQAPSTGLTMEAGCHVLDGQQALAYVRVRKDFYEDLNGDGEFSRSEQTQNSDLQRNRRQQDFLVLALEKAIDSGARELLLRNDLIDAGAQAVILDNTLSVRDLKDLGEAFADFSPDNLVRYNFVSPIVYDDTVGAQAVLRLDIDEAQGILDVFRGLTGLRPDEVTLDVVDARTEVVPDEVAVAEQLASKGFTVGDSQAFPDAVNRTTVRFTADQRDQAVLVARYLAEMPDFELVPGVGGTLVLLAGDDIGFLFVARDPQDVERALEDVSPAPEEVPTTVAETSVVPSAPTQGGGPTDTVGSPDVADEVTTTTVGIMGRPPEGVDCR